MTLESILALASFPALFTLMALRVPIGVSMILVGLAGFAAIVGLAPAISLLAQSPIRTATDELFGVIPMFILMGAIASVSGLSKELFTSGNAWLGHRRGGLAMAGILACGGFAAICGSSVASAATMGKVVLPEMRRYKYNAAFASGTVAAGGTLGILIPPSIVLALYGILTEQDVGALFMAGLLPGILAIVFYIGTIQIILLRRPGLAPVSDQKWDARTALSALRGVWATGILFIFVIGGIYTGAFTPTEAAGMGAVGIFVISVLRRKLTFESTLDALVSAASATGTIFIITIGAIIFGYFLAITQGPQALAGFIVSLDWSPYWILFTILLAYLFLGAFLDSIAIIVLTVPIMFPIISNLGFDPIWFGIVLVMVVEIGLVTPPYGMNVFVLKSVAPDVRLGQIFKGVSPFIASDILRLALIVAFPKIVMFLPTTMG